MFIKDLSLHETRAVRLSGAPAGHDARALAEIALKAKGTPVIHIALDDLRAAFLAEALAFFAPHVEVVSFPAWDCLPYDRISPSAELVARRLAALARLGDPFEKPCILLTTVAGATQRTLPPDSLAERKLALSVGGKIDLNALTRFLADTGYHATSLVREPGEFAIRGGIVDLFPSGSENPIRLDLWGDEIETLRTFDPLSQKTTGNLNDFTLSCAREVLLDPRSIATFREGYRELFGAVLDGDPLYEAVSAGRPFPGVEHWLPLFYPHLTSLFDLLPDAPVTLDPQAPESLAARRQQIWDFYESRRTLYEAARRGKDKNVVAYKPVPPERLYLTEEAWTAALTKRNTFALSPFEEGANDVTPEGQASTLTAQGKPGRDFADARATGTLYEAVASFAAAHQAQSRRVLLACYSQGSGERLAGVLKTHGLTTTGPLKSFEETRPLDPKLLAIVILGLERGFTAPDIAVLTEQDILGDRMVRRSPKRKLSAQFKIDLSTLAVGDFVVHAEHGIGRYEGLEAVAAAGASHDCVKLVYDGGDKLFVPVENMDVISRYASAESGATLDKLGGAGWQARKARVKKRLLDIAEDLLKIAAERHVKKADIIEAEESSYQEFAARFPYHETDDQTQAIGAVLDDLARGRPMDRLVCGDVGFGKTEIALRAAFAAVKAGYQVALIAPTTLLARQHHRTFEERFAGFPYRIAQLSRMVTTRQADEAKELLKKGDVHIVVGTHALLAQDISFANLGLMIVDEEQRFGVKQKERLKALRADVHVLTLTATPIPRTLQMALSGVRELSLIATPPVDRLAVRTFVLPYDPLVIREALMREHFRGGQSFYVCPRIEDLPSVAADLRELVPDLKIQSAHGRMGATELDDIMTAFDAGKFDILLATNIVESGLDIPAANTIVIHRADMFGLAQLYQLRGRVGRAKQRGYAYLTYAPNAALSQTAQQRLEVIGTLDQLGAGFQLASHDMEIRGSGNLLGEEQSGHIREVGVELYQQMLEEAIAAARAGTGREELPPTTFSPQIAIGITVMIPETYIADLGVRLALYGRLASAEDEPPEAIAAEMRDRFGPLPQEVENLLQTVEIKSLCRKAGIAKLDAGPRGAVLSFHKDSFSRPDKLVAWITEQAGTVKVRPDQKLVLMRAWAAPEARIAGLKTTLQTLAEMAA